MIAQNFFQGMHELENFLAPQSCVPITIAGKKVIASLKGEVKSQNKDP